MSEALVLQPATTKDAPVILALVREAYAKWVPIIGREPKPMTADYAVAAQDHRIDLLYFGDKLAALIEMIQGADHLLIENVAVSPVFQGRGFGIKLLSHAERVAASLGYDEIRLYANQLFAENITLYRKLGYRIDREEAFSGGVMVHMSKPLGARSSADRI